MRATPKVAGWVLDAGQWRQQRLWKRPKSTPREALRQVPVFHDVHSDLSRFDRTGLGGLHGDAELRQRTGDLGRFTPGPGDEHEERRDAIAHESPS